MSRNLSAAQSNARNTDEFRQKLAILHQAAIGVVLCRTREPFRAIEAMRDFAFGEKMDFRVWTISRGWATYNRTNPSADPTCDKNIQPLSALEAVGSDAFPATSICVMMYPHKPLAQNITMIQVIKEYCRLFAEGKKRLVLITPPGWDLPQELEDDVSILDFDVPSYAEIRETYEGLLGFLKEKNSNKVPKYGAEEIDRILAAGAGMTAHEFENAVARALVMFRPSLPNVPIDDFVDVIMKVKTEVVKRSEVLEVMEADSIENIGGLDNLKAWVGKRAHCFSQEAINFGVEPPKGIALIGPPGTGKSASAKAIAHVLGLPLLKFDVGRVFNSLVGSSEQRVRSALKMVDAMAPCVLMIDEADKAVGSPGTELEFAL